MSLLREVKYMEASQTVAIPETAMQIYATRAALMQYVANLEITINAYNKVGVDQAVNRQVWGFLTHASISAVEAGTSVSWNI